MRAPAFWDRPEPSWQARALTPLGWACDAATRLRFYRARPHAGALPVVCVGNLTAGGAGKTPAALALESLLRARGLAAAFLSRGYGGAERGPLAVDPARHTAEAVGDEPLLLARAAPTIVARDRRAGARLIEETGADIVVMDDGLQNPSLVKTVSLALVDADIGIGNGRVIPAGPLRAALRFQLGLVDALVLVGEGDGGERIAQAARERTIPIFRAALRARDTGWVSGERVVAFAGIGRPEKFFASLEAAGARIAARRAFGDHHSFSEREANDLLALAERERALLVSTEKDLARMKGSRGAAARLADRTRPLAISLVFETPEAIVELLRHKGALARRR